jgi:hypothetical protein
MEAFQYPQFYPRYLAKEKNTCTRYHLRKSLCNLLESGWFTLQSHLGRKAWENLQTMKDVCKSDPRADQSEALEEAAQLERRRSNGDEGLMQTKFNENGLVLLRPNAVSEVTAEIFLEHA